MEHYYSAAPATASDPKTVEYRALGMHFKCTTDAGVFCRDGLDMGTRILLEALPELSGRILDLGCGWGPVGCCMAARWPQAEIGTYHEKTLLFEKESLGGGLYGPVALTLLRPEEA